MDTANFAWQQLLRDTHILGSNVSPRNQASKELIGYSRRILMAHPLVTVKERQLSYRFAAAEALWILTGSNMLRDLLPYAPSYSRFSDDGLTLAGAYGPGVITQLQYVVETLIQDHESRQAVIGLWNRNPRPSKDVPCTLSLQFLVRDQQLHCVANMRSSDAWLGWPYDVFSFTMITAYVFLLYRMAWYERRKYLCTVLQQGLGTLSLIAGSQHLYEQNWAGARTCYQSTDYLKIVDLSIHELTSPDHLLACLGHVRDGKCDTISVIDQPRFFTEMTNLGIAHEEAKG